jgi:diguanylate cyclase (GGDEF)-like protein
VTTKVIVLSVVLWTVTIGGAALLVGPQHWHTRSVWPWWIALPVMAVLFGLTEVFVVHLHLRGDAHTFSMVELPLALGLFFVQPLVMIAGHVLGGGAALVFHRKQPLLKLGFNTAVFASSATVAIMVFRFLAPDQAYLNPVVLLCGAAALAVANLASLSLILVVISLSSGTKRPTGLWSGVGFGAMTGGFTISLGVIAVIVVDAQPALSWLLVVPIAGTYLANWAYTTERRRHQGLDFLYQSTRLLHQSPELESAILDLLRHAQDTFCAEHAELVYWTETAGEPLRLGVGPDARVLAMDHSDDNEHLVTIIQNLSCVQLFLASDNGPGAAFLASRGFDDAIVAPLIDDEHVLGALVVAGHLSDIRGFDDNDLRLADTLASHTAIALKNGHLEQSLEQLRILEGRLSFQASHDPLTDLANRTLFRHNLTVALTEHGGTRGAVLFIDLDDFKTVNDTLGHAAGDELLLEVAARLRTCADTTDTVARLGGDEFAVLLPLATQTDHATQTAQQILSALNSPVHIASRPVEIRASIGIAIATPDTDAETLMRSADTAMYQAKAQGKHQHVTFHPSMYESSLRRYNLHTDLLRALEQHELCAHYQPIVALDTQQVVGVEALVRWHHPTLGLLMPDSFLHVAEETGLIAALDMAVLNDACAWLAQTDTLHPGVVPTVNINLSPHCFRQAGLTTRILNTLDHHHLDPTRLCVEVTENLMAEETEHAIDILHILQQHGIQIALDDFGTGYSSLSHLRTLPIDTIKIAKPFVDDLDTPGNQHVFATAIITLSQALNKTVVAEGIERPEQLNTLKTLGCDNGQGFLIARPMDQHTFQTWLHHHHHHNHNHHHHHNNNSEAEGAAAVAVAAVGLV